MSIEGIKKKLSDLMAADHGEPVAGHCRKCQKPFTSENVFTPAGWKETEISQMCEACFDAMFGAVPGGGLDVCQGCGIMPVLEHSTFCEFCNDLREGHHD